MEFLGEYLKKERERRNLSLKEVEESTRIRERFIRAIEEERFESLPSPFYAEKFLRLYADFLGLNANDILNQFRQDHSSLSVKPFEIPPYLIRQKRKVSPSTVLLLLLGIVGAGVLVYFIPRESPKQILSSTPLEIAVTPPVERLWTAQERGEGVFIPEADQEGHSEPQEVPVKEMRGESSLSYEVVKAGLGSGIQIIQNRPELTGVSSEFGCNHQRVYFLTRIHTPASGKISHVWIWKGKEVQRIDMKVEAPAWSIYSYVTIRPHQTGQWKVEVRYGSSTLFSQTFEVAEYDHLT